MTVHIPEPRGTDSDWPQIRRQRQGRGTDSSHPSAAELLAGGMTPSVAGMLALQRLAGNERVSAVVQRQGEAHEPAGAPVGGETPLTTADAPLAGAGPISAADLFRPLTEEDLWVIERPQHVSIDVTMADGPAAASAPGPVQIQVTYGRASEAHTAPAGPGAAPGAGPSTDIQDQLTAAVVIQMHRPNQAGPEIAFQGQMNWDPTVPANAESVGQLSGVQLGVQGSLVSAVWHRCQAAIYLQVMGGAATPAGGASPQVQGSGGGQVSFQLTDNLQLFFQVGGGGTVTGTPAGASATGDVSGTIGITGTF